MCGIAGFAGPFNKKHLIDMTDIIRHRGPDGEGHHFQSMGSINLGLGHRRLSIIDLSTGSQPMWNENHSIAVVFNGEIYNYLDLRRFLISKGHVFSTTSDTEVLLHGYEQYGDSFTEHLEGMFSFAIWDDCRKRLFLARDRFGIKPLYYFNTEKHGFAFASEIKALLLLFKNIEMNKNAFYRHCLFGWNSSEETIFQDISSLLPGHFLIWENGKIRKTRYWNLTERVKNVSKEDAKNEIIENLSASVKSHMIADVPVGLTLSGGLDSSSILACMKRSGIDLKNINAFSFGWGLPNDEIPYAQEAATFTGISLKTRTEPLSLFSEEFEKIIWHLEEPIPHPVMGLTFFLSRMLQENLKVVLIGEGSDELFGGYPHYHLFRNHFNILPDSIHFSLFRDIQNLMPTPTQWGELLTKDFYDKELMHLNCHIFDEQYGKSKSPQKRLLYDIEHQLHASQLIRVDKLMMAHSIEARVPFLDRNFAENALAIPFKFKLNTKTEKVILRDAMQNQLPERVLYRPKSGPKGTQPLLPVLINNVFRERLNDILNNGNIFDYGWFDKKKTKKFIMQKDSFLISRHPLESRRRLKFAFFIIVFETWTKTFLNQKGLLYNDKCRKIY